jgi:ubiquinone/menaquinone biosynthesis C-methylase UbiE
MYIQSDSWKEIWEAKGLMPGTKENIREYEGWENAKAGFEEIAGKIAEALDLKPTDKVLEVGCAAGALSEYLDCDYVGVDYSASLVKRNIEFFKNQCMIAEAADLPFKDAWFDKVFCYGVFQYFPDKDYTRKAVSELLRVCKPGGRVLIGDLAKSSHDAKHQLHSETEYEGWRITKGWASPYEDLRFNALYQK